MKFLNKSIAIGLLIGIYSPILISCSYLPEPLNDPAVSTFGKKCNEETWSYIWIYKRGENLTATEENCKIPINKS